MVLTVIQSCLQAGLEVGGGWVKTEFITHSGSSEPSLDSESKLEPSVAKMPNFREPSFCISEYF